MMSAALIGILSVLVGIDVIARNVLGHGFVGTHDLLTIGLILFFFTALPYSFYDDAHVRMDIIYARASPWLRLLADSLGIIGAVIFLGSMAWGAGSRILYVMKIRSATPTIGLPMWPVVALVALVSLAAIVVLLLGVLAATRKSKVQA